MEGRTWTLTVDHGRMKATLCVPAETDVDPETLRQSVVSSGISFGLNAAVLENALRLRGTSVTIAKGQHPQPGVDDRIQYCLDEQELLGAVETKITDNFLPSHHILSVRPGDVLAVKIPGRPGVAGMNVYGHSVAPPPFRQIKLRALSGTEISADGVTVLATIAGRPRVEPAAHEYRFQVIPVYIHRGDFTVETNHLSFDGDIVVMGNLSEGTSIRANGSVEVYGNVNGAGITAGQSVKITGNVIQSTIRAGMDKKILRKLLPLLEQAGQLLYHITEVMRQLDKRGQLEKLPFAGMAQKVVELRFSDYNEVLAQINDAVTCLKEETPGEPGAEDFLQLLSHIDPANWQSESCLTTAAKQIFSLQKKFAGLGEAKSDIVCNYTLNSHLQADGTITVRASGCFHSILDAGESAVILGILRGGSVTANKQITARTVGSEAAVLTTLQVESAGRIEVDAAFENTVFNVGKKSLKVQHVVKFCKTSFDEDGRLRLAPR